MKRNRPLDTRQLQVFVSLAATGSFTRSAENLYVTQSAVSHSMKSLEKEVGCDLMRRVGKKIMLTPAGARLLAFAHPLLDEMEKVKKELPGSSMEQRSDLRVAANDAMLQFFLPALLKELEVAIPECRLEIKGGSTAECLGLMKENQVDLILSVEPHPSNTSEFIPCFSDELKMVVHPEHKWAKLGWTEWAKINSERFIATDPHGYTSHAFLNFLKDKQIQIDCPMVMKSAAAVKELIKCGVGIGVLPDWFVAKDVKRGELVSLPLGSKRLMRTWGISFLKGKEMSFAENYFTRLVQKIGCEWMVHRETARNAKI